MAKNIPGNGLMPVCLLPLNLNLVLSTVHLQVVLDHRANHPVFKLSCSGVVLQGFKIDMIGFR